MSSKPNTVVLGTALGITSSAIFFGANLSISFLTVPVLLLPSPKPALPVPANSENTNSPTSSSSQRPATKFGHLARQWQEAYNVGKKAGPFFALLASGCWLYAAKHLPSEARLQRQLLWAASGLSIAIVPFTFGVMKRTNDELNRRADAATRDEEDDSKAHAQQGTVESYQTHDLIQWWAQLSFL
ncbi:hypothetical protein Z517_11883 [Fonsecaea pedrosoi CBS 271.37]|uniref:Uncharacterized protein n=1 Tax=Fonsecaea pedrosoi CBS 271.37 TaxID=1442368 RepID=A0A0D2EL18_9EURO|nr:uncharacterized protein Z517_11883 [Fonsecaea pedrosoi CBS 271.37]KIW75112.1 hypothetical protein Z517_11883 [Fonsecaea pedrosoi CBS 271.37]